MSDLQSRGPIVFAAVIICLATLGPSAAEADRPNVLLIMTDNHGPWTLGCYGNEEIRTPHIDGVGRVMETLRRLHLDENTLVIFTADQGLCGGHHGMWGMGDHSRPLHTYDETAWIPLIYRHPSRIPPGRRSDLMVSNYDFYRTVLNYLGLEDEIPDAPESPGRDYSAVLLGRQIPWENVIYYEFENSRMIRTPDWKYTRRFPDGPHELYDLKSDAGERNNLAGQSEQTEIEARMRKRLEAFFDRYADPKYDLWRGGGAKTRVPSWQTQKPK